MASMETPSRSVDPLVVGKVIGDVVDMFVPAVEFTVEYASKQITNNGVEIKPAAAAQKPRVHIKCSPDSNNLYTLDIPEGADASQDVGYLLGFLQVGRWLNIWDLSHQQGYIDTCSLCLGRERRSKYPINHHKSVPISRLVSLQVTMDLVFLWLHFTSIHTRNMLQPRNVSLQACLLITTSLSCFAYI